MQEERKKGAPAWMVSFGDMMTLILTFFILLISLAREQAEGLVAQGIGSFVVELRSFGLPGLLSKDQEFSVFDDVRQRFNLPPETDPERREEHAFAASLELIRAKEVRSMAPHDELNQPSVATFAPDSAELSEASKTFIDLIATTLRPRAGQLLLLEGHAQSSGGMLSGDDRWLAFERAQSVRDYLIDAHGFRPARVEARAWVDEVVRGSTTVRSVDARLIVPAPPAAKP
ncbi:MAG: OmpA family protein [Planctomycetota bacterium]|nr:OmpA family protein [Planctomycetota bacterium]